MVGAKLETLTHGQTAAGMPIGMFVITRAKAAELLNVGERSVARARQVLDKGVPGARPGRRARRRGGACRCGNRQADACRAARANFDDRCLIGPRLNKLVAWCLLGSVEPNAGNALAPRLAPGGPDPPSLPDRLAPPNTIDATTATSSMIGGTDASNRLVHVFNFTALAICCSGRVEPQLGGGGLGGRCQSVFR
jgi:hypothetical protein